MKIILYLITIPFLIISQFSCNTVKLDRLFYYKNDSGLICPDIIYYNILYDSASYTNNDLSFVSSGNSFDRFKGEVQSLIKTYSDSLSVRIPIVSDSRFILTTNVKIDPHKIGGWITDEQRSYWITRYRKGEIKSIQIENLIFPENQNIMIINFYFLKVNEGRVYVTGAINGILRLDIAVIQNNKVKSYQRYVYDSFRENTSKLHKYGDDLPWFKEKHVKALVAKVFEEFKNCK